MRSERERLLDILEAIERIEKYAAEGKAAFEADELIQNWMVNHISVIGDGVPFPVRRVPGALCKCPLGGHYRNEKYPCSSLLRH
jgi:hypothetical protein